MGPFGMGEIIVIAMIALVVLGPEKFPEFAKIAMRAFRDLRGYVDDIKREMAEEVKPIKEEMHKLSQYDPEEYIAPFAEAMAAVDAPEEKKEEESKPDSSPAPEGDAAPSTEDATGSDETPTTTPPSESASPYREEMPGETHDYGNPPQVSSSPHEQYPD